MSVALSVRLPDKLAKELSNIALATERSKSFLIQKALESYLRDQADLQVSLDRLRDTSDSVISMEEMRKKLAYNITFKKSVAKDLKKIGRSEANRILKKLTSELPVKAHQLPELQGQFVGLSKYRVGDYRVIFTIIDNSVLVLRIQHRKDVYRN